MFNIVVAVAGLEPATSCFMHLPLKGRALPTELHGIPYIFIPHTSSWQPHQPTTYAEPIRTIGLAIRIPYFNSFFMLPCYGNHIRPSILTTFPRTCATTCQPYCSHRDQPVVTAGSEITSLRPVVLTGLVPSLSTPSALRSISLPFQLRALHDPRHLSVGHGVITATAYSPPILPLCIQYIQPTCRDCSLHVPRRLVEGGGLEPPAHPRLFMMSPPSGRNAVAFIRSVGHLFQSCRFAPVIPAFPFLLFF